MMSIRDLEELDESLHAMGVSNMDALQRARALLDHAASKKLNSSTDVVHSHERPPSSPKLESNIKQSALNEDLKEKQEEDHDDEDSDIHSDVNSIQYEHNSLIYEMMQDEDLVNEMKNVKIQGIEDSNELHDLGFQSPMREIWGRRLDDLSSPSVSLATISEDEEHYHYGDKNSRSISDNDEEEDESSLDHHNRLYARDSLDIDITATGSGDMIDDTVSQDILRSNAAGATLSSAQNVLSGSGNNTWDDEDLSVESVDRDALMERFQLLESTKLSLLNQCSYLESKLERKTSKLIQIEEQNKELELRLQRIEEDNRDDMKDVMMKMNAMEISYQERIISQEKKIVSLEAELKKLKILMEESVSHGSNRTKDTISTLDGSTAIPSIDTNSSTITTPASTAKFSTGTWRLSRKKAIAKNQT